MAMIVLRVPEYTSQRDDRPAGCPYCGSLVYQTSGQIVRKVKGAQSQVSFSRNYRCLSCGRFFRFDLQGISHAAHASQVRRLAALMWILGIDVHDVVEFFEKFRVKLHLTQVWREGQELLVKLAALDGPSPEGRLRLREGSFGHNGASSGVNLAVDFGMGDRIVLGALKELDPWTVIFWLRPLLEDVDLEVSLFGTHTLDLQPIDASDVWPRPPVLVNFAHFLG